MSDFQETIDFTVQARKPITLRLRIVGAAEERQLRQRYFGLTEAEQDEKSYELNTKLLAGLAVSIPDEMRQKEGEAADYDSGAAAVLEYFKEQTPTKEHVADAAVRAYFSALSPPVVFK